MKSSRIPLNSRVTPKSVESSRKSKPANPLSNLKPVKQKPIASVSIRRNIESGNTSLRSNASTKQANPSHKEKKENKLNVDKKDDILNIERKKTDQPLWSKIQRDNFPVESDSEYSDESWFDSDESLESFSDGNNALSEFNPSNRRMKNLVGHEKNDEYHYGESNSRLESRERDNDSTAYKYIERFRSGNAMNREERTKERVLDPQDFWWVGDIPEPTSSIIVTSTSSQLQAGALPPHSTLQNTLSVNEVRPDEWSSALPQSGGQTMWSRKQIFSKSSRAVPLVSEQSKEYEGIHPTQKAGEYKASRFFEEEIVNDEESRLTELEAKFESLQRRVNKFQERDNHSEVSSRLAAVSSAGLGSSDSFLIAEREFSEKPYRPEFTTTLALKTRGGVVPGYGGGMEDILAQWRARRRLELLRPGTNDNQVITSMRNVLANGTGAGGTSESLQGRVVSATHNAEVMDTVTTYQDELRNPSHAILLRDAEIQTDVECDSISTQTVDTKRTKLKHSVPQNHESRLRSKSCHGSGFSSDKASTERERECRCCCCCGSGERTRGSGERFSRRPGSTERLAEHHRGTEYDQTPVKLEKSAPSTGQCGQTAGRAVRCRPHPTALQDHRPSNQSCKQKLRLGSDSRQNEILSRDKKFHISDDPREDINNSDSSNLPSNYVNGNLSFKNNPVMNSGQTSGKSENTSTRQYSPRHSSLSPRRRHVSYDDDAADSLTNVTSRSFTNTPLPGDSYFSADLEVSGFARSEARTSSQEPERSTLSNSPRLHSVIEQVVSERLFADYTPPGADTISHSPADDVDAVSPLSNSQSLYSQTRQYENIHESHISTLDLYESSDGDEFKDDLILQELRRRRTEYINKLCNLHVEQNI